MDSNGKLSFSFRDFAVSVFNPTIANAKTNRESFGSNETAFLGIKRLDDKWVPTRENQMHCESYETTLNISGEDALMILELINHSLSCGSENDLKNLFETTQQLFAFDFAAAELGFYDPMKGPVVTDTVNISFPDEWAYEYISRNYHQLSSLTRENFKTYQLQYLVNTWKKYQQMNEIISLCLDFEIKSGYAHGSAPSGLERTGSMFIFAGPGMKYDIRTAAILEIIVPHLHQAYSRIADRKNVENSKAVLSAREKEILNWLKQGKSSWDMSVILGISQNTVNFHVYNILRKLGASNRPQAVAVAIHRGIISPM
jgi:DNA-binding CsgD family transcriptional regulator